PHAESAPNGDNATLAGTRVLVVDDDPDFLDMSVLALRQEGAQVRAVSSAARAYEVVRDWGPKVVFTDLAVPAEDAVRLARAMRTRFPERGLPVSTSAVTAYGTPESRARAVEAGFDRYLTKPVAPADLVDAVAKIIRPDG